MKIIHLSKFLNASQNKEILMNTIYAKYMNILREKFGYKQISETSDVNNDDNKNIEYIEKNKNRISTTIFLILLFIIL